MIIFFDKYTENTRKVQETMECLNADVKIVVLEDDGFLPKGILSPYEYYVSQQNDERNVEKDLFYDFLEVPEYWEIRATGAMGGIYDMGIKKADIYFTEPIEKKIVQRVEWQMEDGWIYKIDYYNKYGIKYASEFLDRDKNIESKVYYSDKNQEVIVVQPQNDVVTLLEDGHVKGFFVSYNEFIKYYLSELKLMGEYVVFAQNEKMLEQLDARTEGAIVRRGVWFSDDELLNKYVGMGGKDGYRFYNISKQYPKNEARKGILILTASDKLEQIENLVCELSDIVFHIAANTQVSDKLYKLAERENVKVYPGMSKKNLENLWVQCDFYLDINHYREIYDAVNEARERNLLILGFENTLHHKELVASECMFSQQDYKKMIVLIGNVMNNQDKMQKLLLMQQEKSGEVLENLMKSLEDGENC